jgi:preprotein translocase subunit SecD
VDGEKEKMSFKKIITDIRVIILIITLIMAVVAIYPVFNNEGVSIKAVQRNSLASLAGIENPKAKSSPLSHEKIVMMNNQPIKDLLDYYSVLDSLEPDQILSIKTNKGLYRIKVEPEIEIIELNETEFVVEEIVELFNETIDGVIVPVNKTINVTKEVKKTETNIIGLKPLGLSVDNAPTSNIRKGLDLQGGTRVLLKPEEDVDSLTFSGIIDSLKERLNIYGLGDIIVTEVSDSPEFLGGGNKYILVEIAGATSEEVKDLIAKQGKFEGKIANQTVFRGGDDITYVCRSADCSGIDPRRPCSKMDDFWGCGFYFSISLRPEAAKRQADVTANLDIIGDHLSEPLILYLDDFERDKLNIASDLRGRAVTDIEISGSGQGITHDEALQDALQNMKGLQTVLITGSLPVKLEIVKIDTISAKLGSQFLSNAFIVAIVVILSIILFLVIVYRTLKLAIPIVIALLSEVILVLGIAALIGWNIDLAAIAGIIVAVGTGVDDQIIIIDEVLRKGSESISYKWKERIKKAFFIIMTAYFTTLVAMIPLLFAGAGLLKGFAITTILGVSVGVFITRPAFASIIKNLIK